MGVPPSFVSGFTPPSCGMHRGATCRDMLMRASLHKRGHCVSQTEYIVYGVLRAYNVSAPSSDI